jgi:hypothetical protein
MKFKKGDIVSCIDGTLPPNEKFIVQEDSSFIDGYEYVKVDKDQPGRGWFVERFIRYPLTRVERIVYGIEE